MTDTQLSKSKTLTAAKAAESEFGMKTVKIEVPLKWVGTGRTAKGKFVPMTDAKGQPSGKMGVVAEALVVEDTDGPWSAGDLIGGYKVKDLLNGSLDLKARAKARAANPDPSKVTEGTMRSRLNAHVVELLTGGNATGASEIVQRLQHESVGDVFADVFTVEED